jgi:hypothetical protein
MATTEDLITRALRLANIVGEGQTPSPEQTGDALSTLNDMVDAWNLDSLMVYQTTSDQVTLIPGQGTYTVGSGANFDIQRPVRINSAYVIYQGVSFPLDEINADEYSKITLKGFEQTLPRFFLYLNTYPSGTLTLWPAPTLAIPLVLACDRVVAAFALGDTLSLAPGYSKALRANLAMELCPEYGREPSASLAKMARESKADIKRANYVPVVASFDTAIVGAPGGLAGFLSGY